MRPIALIESDRRVRQEAGQEAWVGSFGSRCCISPNLMAGLCGFTLPRVLFPHTFSSYLSHPPNPRGYPLSRIGSHCSLLHSLFHSFSSRSLPDPPPLCTSKRVWLNLSLCFSACWFPFPASPTILHIRASSRLNHPFSSIMIPMPSRT